MTRLIVEAVSGETKFVDLRSRLELFVSVARAADGAPVTGLKAQDFRFCSPAGSVYGLTLEGGREATWEGVEGEGTGCYSLSIAFKPEKSGRNPAREWMEGEFYPFGIEVHYQDADGAIHLGQTVVRVQSLGK
jgi:hypothetical protein